jgi:negative regulator of flagellin synthesis FlgM
VDIMTPIDPAKLSISQRQKAGIVTPLNRTAPAQSVGNATGKPAASATGSAGLSSLTAGADAPINTDRVAEIRKAVEDGSYPLVPTRIADAMIAAGFLLRAPK